MTCKKILLTGSLGFIGSNFVRKVLFDKLDYQLVSVDYCKLPNVLNNIYANKNHKFYLGDIADAHLMNVIFEIERPDIVVNMAAESFVDASISSASPFIHSNVLGTQVLLDASVKWGVKHFVQVSTDEVLGHLVSPSDPSWTEESPLAPRNPYSASKAAAEHLVQAAHQTHGLPFSITRSCNNFGPRQQARNFIPKIIKSTLNNQPVPVYGKGENLREWIYVEDNISAILTILGKGKINEIYNISSGYEFSNLEIFQEVCNVFGRGHSLLEFVKDRPGHDYRYSVSSNKLRSLGWKPQFKFRAGLSSTCNWYEKNQWFLK